MLSKKAASALIRANNVQTRTIVVSSVMQGDAVAPVFQGKVALPKVYEPHELPQEIKDLRYPKLGNRDIVGPGVNDNPSYLDFKDFPMPAVRWRANTTEVLALRDKEKGDWKTLSLEEKKTLYRNSYRQTFAEIDAPTGEWKRILAYMFYGFSISISLVIGSYLFVFPSTPETLNQDHTQKMLKRMLQQNQGPINGISSKYDFEKGAWK